MSRPRSVFLWVVLVLSGITGIGNLIERAVTDSPAEPLDLWPCVAAAYAADELLRHRGSKRPARAAAAVGGSLLVAICCWAGGSAVRDLVLGRDTDWFGLGLGVLGGGLAVVGVLSWRTERYERRARNEHNERDEQDERSAAGSAY